MRGEVFRRGWRRWSGQEREEAVERGDNAEADKLADKGDHGRAGKMGVSAIGEIWQGGSEGDILLEIP